MLSLINWSFGIILKKSIRFSNDTAILNNDLINFFICSNVITFIFLSLLNVSLSCDK